MDLELTDKLALVSGSTAGIGFAIAAALAGEGCRVIITGRSEERVAAGIKKIQEQHPGAKVEGVSCDLATSQGAAGVIQRYPEVDILINNLGIYEERQFEETGDADWQRLIEVNFMSGVRLCRHYLPRLKARGWGRIIFLASESGVNIPVEMIHYGVTKAMYLALSRGLAETTMGTAVTVNAVLPGPTRSEGVNHFIAKMAQSRKISPEEVEREFFRSVRPTSLLQRFTSPAEVANLVIYLASLRASGTNGAALRVDGGVVRSII
jgi:NAD(P)-dependent dehydrogenase (short-subunit alcohol dehydrogenase family)